MTLQPTQRTSNNMNERTVAFCGHYAVVQVRGWDSVKIEKPYDHAANGNHGTPSDPAPSAEEGERAWRLAVSCEAMRRTMEELLTLYAEPFKSSRVTVKKIEEILKWQHEGGEAPRCVAETWGS